MHLVELLEADERGILTEGLAGHVQAVLLDQTDGAAALNAAMAQTLARGVLAFV